jgi:hypothetical protein
MPARALFWLLLAALAACSVQVSVSYGKTAWSLPLCTLQPRRLERAAAC